MNVQILKINLYLQIYHALLFGDVSLAESAVPSMTSRWRCSLSLNWVCILSGVIYDWLAHFYI